MSPDSWLLVHLVAVAVLTGVGWVVQVVVYPGFAQVGDREWPAFHGAHLRAIARVVGVPWAVQGVSTVALLLAPPPDRWAAVLVLAALAAGTVASTVLVAVPAHRRLGHAERGHVPGRELAVLLRSNLARTLVWTAATGVAAVLLA
jgi:hypothetical protein